MPKTPFRADDTGAERYEIAAVSNALAIVGAMADKGVISLADARDAAGVTKTTAYRLLATLRLAGVAEQLPEGGYRPGREAVRWASRIIAGLDVRAAALPTMHRLQAETGETVNLALIRGTTLLYVEILESPSSFRMADVPGSTAPIHATALGRVIARHLDPARLASMLGPEPYPAYTAKTARTYAEFKARLDRSEGSIAVDNEEVAVGVVCTAAPILVAGEVLGALSVSAPRARCDDARLEDLGRRIATAAEVVSRELATTP